MESGKRRAKETVPGGDADARRFTSRSGFFCWVLRIRNWTRATHAGHFQQGQRIRPVGAGGVVTPHNANNPPAVKNSFVKICEQADRLAHGFPEQFIKRKCIKHSYDLKCHRPRMRRDPQHHSQTPTSACFTASCDIGATLLLRRSKSLSSTGNP